MGYFFEEEYFMLLPGLISSLVTGIPSGLFGIAAFILTAVAIYNIALRRGLHRPWLAWIPVVNCWLLGSLSDQYQYVVKGEYKARRKWLVVLNILKIVLTFTLIILAVAMAGTIFTDHADDAIGLVVALLGLLLPLAGVSIAFCVIRYIALYDVFRSLEPANSVMYLVLSILFRPIEPFFLFFSRDKDLGMPPRRQQPDRPQFQEECRETSEYL